MEKDNKKQFKEMMNRLAKVDKKELLKKMTYRKINNYLL